MVELNRGRGEGRGGVEGCGTGGNDAWNDIRRLRECVGRLCVCASAAKRRTDACMLCATLELTPTHPLCGRHVCTGGAAGAGRRRRGRRRALRLLLARRRRPQVRPPVRCQHAGVRRGQRRRGGPVGLQGAPSCMHAWSYHDCTLSLDCTHHDCTLPLDCTCHACAYLHPHTTAPNQQPRHANINTRRHQNVCARTRPPPPPFSPLPPTHPLPFSLSTLAFSLSTLLIPLPIPSQLLQPRMSPPLKSASRLSRGRAVRHGAGGGLPRECAGQRPAGGAADGAAAGRLQLRAVQGRGEATDCYRW